MLQILLAVHERESNKIKEVTINEKEVSLFICSFNFAFPFFYLNTKRPCDNFILQGRIERNCLIIESRDYADSFPT